MKLDETHFETNLEIFSRTNAQAAVEIAYANNEQVVFCKSDSGDLNLKLGKGEFVHSQKSPVDEANEWFSSLDLRNKDVLYVFGVGLGYYYQAAKSWLKDNPERHLVFLEDNLTIVHRLLETSEGTALLRDPQVHLHTFSQLGPEESSFEWLYWNFILKQIAVSSLRYYEKTRADLYTQLSQKILYEAAGKNDMADEYLKYGIAFFRNFYPNQLFLHESALGNALFGKFKGVPAIICGAGPSLQKNLAVLKKLQNHALIFAGGSAINALNAQNLSPHFGAGIDPNPAQYVRYAGNTAFEVPFFYRNRLQHQAFRTIHGPRLYITGAGGYDVAEWFENELGISGAALDEGHNVVNFCAEIAQAMGCNPIIFVGLDLAFSQMQSYATGVVEKSKVTKKQLEETDQFESAAIRWKNIYGKPVYTLWKWIAEAEWIANFAKRYPDTTVLNATEGGIGFEGIRNLTLKEAAEIHLKRSFDLKGWVHTEIQNAAMPQVTLEKSKEAMTSLKTGLEECMNHLDILIEELESVKTMIKEGREPPIGFHTGRSALAETELTEQPAFHVVLEMFNVIFQHIYNRQFQILSSSMDDPEKVLQLLDLQTKRYTFLRETAQVNQFLIEEALKDEA